MIVNAHAAGEDDPIRLHVGNRVLNPIDSRLFGQFLERPSWGETGPEAAVNHEGSLPGDITTELRAMRIPIVRFPGGTDVDFTDWTDMVSNVPGRAEPGRPVTVGHQGHKVTNRFGYDEYFRLAKDLDWQTILVVNFLDGLLKRKPLDEAARHAAGLVAYVTAREGSKLPPGMPDWPALRRSNGHAEPHGVRIFQIGNEWFMGHYKEHALKTTGARDMKELAAWYVTCIAAYADAMRAVDPGIELIMDAQMGDGELERLVLEHPEVRRRVQYVAMHRYAPWKTAAAERDGKSVPLDSLDPAETWLALASTPGCYEDGVSTAFGTRHLFLKDLGYKVAATEWNWNGSGLRALRLPAGLHYTHAAALGAAGFLQGLLRLGDLVAIANQSMLVGQNWQIAAIRPANPEKGSPLHLNGQGAVTTLYNLHHGDRRLELTAEHVPTVVQHLALGAASPIPQVALLDAVATRSEKSLYLHVINRACDRDLAAEIDLKALGVGDSRATLHSLVPAPMEADPRKMRAIMINQDATATVRNGIGAVVFPRCSVSVMEINLE